uniref:Putative tick kunitz 1 n=1 Tax=Amblyomma cajennense TaxID=34607 RepID=A0A023FRE3_AMBCJ
MQLLTLFALLCLLGSTLTDATLPRRCRQQVKEAKGSCYNGKGPIKRFGYYPFAKKCHEFWESGCLETPNQNSFANLTECLTTCNPTSKCLKTPIKHTKLLSLKKSFVFDIKNMKCVQEKTLLRPGIGPDINRFLKKEDCTRQCEPDLIQDITSSG